MSRFIFVTICVVFLWNVGKKVSAAFLTLNLNDDQSFLWLNMSITGQTVVCSSPWDPFYQRFLVESQDHEMCDKLYDAALAEIETTDENSFIYNQSVALKANFWLGGDDLQTEGEWKWLSTQQPVGLNAWCAGNPSNSALNENCLEMNNDCHGWNDDSCSKFQKYICEKHAGNLGVIG